MEEGGARQVVTQSKSPGWDAIRRDVQSTTRRNAVTVSKELMALARERDKRRRQRERTQYLLDLTYSRRCLNSFAEWYSVLSVCMTFVVFFLCVIAIAHLNTPSNVEEIRVPALILCACWVCALGCMGICTYAIEVADRRDAQTESNGSCCSH